MGRSLDGAILADLVQWVGCGHLLAGALWVSTGDSRNPIDWPPVHGVSLQEVQIHFKIKEVKLLFSLGEQTV